MSLSTKNAANTSGFARESEPIYGLYGEEGEGFLYKFKSYDSNPEAFMAFSPDKIIYGNFVTDTTLQFTLTGTIPAADASNADYNMTGSGSAVILYTYYGIPAPVPEPSSAALALAGLAMLFTRRRRKVLS